MFLRGQWNASIQRSRVRRPAYGEPLAGFRGERAEVLFKEAHEDASNSFDGILSLL